METTTEKTQEETIQEMIQMDISVIKIRERMRYLAQNNEFSREYYMWEMALSDWTTGVNTAFEKGVEKGREMAMSDWTTGVNTAIEKNRIEVARNALAEGATPEFIQKITGACHKNCVNDHKMVEIPKERKWSWHERNKKRKKILSINCLIISISRG